MPELKQYKPLIWFSGGEPLVNPDMISIIQLFTKEGLCTSLTTNGFVLAHFAKAIAKSGLDFISLSLDSDVAHEHDQGRGIKGSFDRLIKGLKLLQKERKLTGTPINIKINSVVKKTNFYKLLRMYDFIESLGVDEWRLQHISYLTPQADKIITKYIKRTGIGEGYTGELISQENYLSTKEVLILSNQLEKIEERSKIYKTRIAIEPKVHDLKAYYQGKWPSKESFCNPAFHQLTIYENGKIGAGCLAYQIGDIYDGRTLKQTWNSQKALFFRNLIKKNKYIPPCFRCCSLNYFF